MKNFFVLAAVVGLVACNNTETETENQVQGQDTIVVAVDSTAVVFDTTVVETEVAQ